VRIPLAKSGMGCCIFFAAIALVLTLLLGIWSLPFWVLAAFVINFFRDPERNAHEPPAAILAPADGKIIQIEPVASEGPFKGYQQISIFMNVFNVHVNRAPAEGRIEKISHFPGGYLPANRDSASSQNERVEIVISSPFGYFMVRLVAGLVARRIVPEVSNGQIVVRGERIGMIKFGSRVDIQMPAGFRIDVGIGDKVIAGITRIATASAQDKGA
jgi:phosphatidylserine decarboxylase